MSFDKYAALLLFLPCESSWASSRIWLQVSLKDTVLGSLQQAGRKQPVSVRPSLVGKVLLSSPHSSLLPSFLP